ncbi:MAG: nucleoside triphosphate pyrophosphohydrolase [Gammaproteobacteria bacterium]|mgnify:CR=1 FL=1|nr:nucleoside triphosphate pyrophosphohydrolase [Gammaproteobacteria bacterium]
MPITRLLNIMSRLRDPNGGCPWDLEQTFQTIAPYTIEEAYEVADAIERGDMSDLREELGDLLFQVVFHSQIAKEHGAFTFEEVVNGICDKMERRHPHVFGTARITSAAEQTKAWEAHKRAERARTARSVLDGVPHALPALTRAAKLGKRAAEVGFEWPDTQGALDKVAEELDELRAELSRSSSPERLANELGDVLFSILNVCRHLNVDPETALRRANAKFERRFRYVEERLREQGKSPAEATLEEMDVLWEQGKREGV